MGCGLLKSNKGGKDGLISNIQNNDNIFEVKNIVVERKELVKELKGQNNEIENNREIICPNNYIIAEIYVTENDRNKNIRIINSFENVRREKGGDYNKSGYTVIFTNFPSKEI